MSWTDLPDELFNLILSREAKKEVCGVKCRLVSKSWKAIESRLQYTHHPLPCLLYYETSHCRWNLFTNHDISSAEIPELEDAKVAYSKNGCLLMSRNSWDFFIFKLENKQIFEIPEPDERYRNISFINQPGSSDCSIIGVTAMRSPPPCVSIGVLKLGEDEWNHYDHECKNYFEMSDCTPIMHRELLYFLDKQGNIGTFDIEKPTEWTMYEECLESTYLREKIKQIYFAKLEEDEGEALFAVFLTDDERNVNVYKLLESDMKWSRVVSLGDKILFVGCRVSFGGKALFKGNANRIYFPEKGLFYCLDKQTYFSCDGECNFPGCSNHATWIDRPPTKFLEVFK